MGVVLSPVLSVSKCCLVLLIFMNEFPASQTACAFQRDGERCAKSLYIYHYISTLTFTCILIIKVDQNDVWEPGWMFFPHICLLMPSPVWPDANLPLSSCASPIVFLHFHEAPGTNAQQGFKLALKRISARHRISCYKWSCGCLRKALTTGDINKRSESLA